MSFSATVRGQINIEKQIYSSNNGVIRIDTFSDSITGETSDRYFVKEFSMSSDDILYTSWYSLTDAELSQFTFNSSGTVYIKIRYTRAGSSTTGTLTFNSISFTDSIVVESCVVGKVATRNPMFRDIFCNHLIVNEIAGNLFEKIKGNGILPDYIVRNQQNPDLDKDFDSLWQSICKYFAFLNVIALQFTGIYNDGELLRRYISVKGLHLNGDEDLETLQFYANNLFAEFFKRGTVLQFKDKDFEFPDGSLNEMKGEFLRLIAKQEKDEFLWNQPAHQFYGWNIGNSSPLYKSISHEQWMINKCFEDKTNTTDLTKYYFNTDVDESIVTDSGRQVIKMRQINAAINSGINQYNEPVIIDPNLPYEFSFELKVESGGNDAKLEIGVILLTSDGVSVVPAIHVDDGDTDGNGTCFSGLVVKRNIYYKFRCLLFPQDTPLDPLRKPVWGNYLKFPSTAKYAAPYITINNDSNDPPLDVPSSWVYLYNLKFKLLENPYSLGLIQTKNLNYFYLLNRSINNNETIKRFLREEFLPYNTNLISNFIENNAVVPTTTTAPTTTTTTAFPIGTTTSTTTTTPTTLPPPTTTTTSSTTTTTSSTTTTTTCPPSDISYELVSGTEVTFSGMAGQILYIEFNGNSLGFHELPYNYVNEEGVLGTYTFTTDTGCIYTINVINPTTTTTTLAPTTTTTTTAAPTTTTTTTAEPTTTTTTTSEPPPLVGEPEDYESGFEDCNDACNNNTGIPDGDLYFSGTGSPGSTTLYVDVLESVFLPAGFYYLPNLGICIEVGSSGAFLSYTNCL